MRKRIILCMRTNYNNRLVALNKFRLKCNMTFFFLRYSAHRQCTRLGAWSSFRFRKFQEDNKINILARIRSSFVSRLIWNKVKKNSMNICRRYQYIVHTFSDHNLRYGVVQSISPFYSGCRRRCRSFAKESRITLSICCMFYSVSHCSATALGQLSLVKPFSTYVYRYVYTHTPVTTSPFLSFFFLCLYFFAALACFV